MTMNVKWSKWMAQRKLNPKWGKCFIQIQTSTPNNIYH